jgi:hypothetical protein
MPAQAEKSDIPDTTRQLIDLSDEIAAINLRIMERSKFGLQDDPEERAHLAELMEELESFERHPKA